MRKLHNKKGFSLVELMIVVVIMGILIAVAIPLYGAVTANAEKRTCQSNMENMHSMFAKYCVIDKDNTANTLLPEGSYSTKPGETNTIATEFLESFENDELPHCSVDGHYYLLTKVDSYTVEIKCVDENGNETAHN